MPGTGRLRVARANGSTGPALLPQRHVHSAALAAPPMVEADFGQVSTRRAIALLSHLKHPPRALPAPRLRLSRAAVCVKSVGPKSTARMRCLGRRTCNGRMLMGGV